MQTRGDIQAGAQGGDDVGDDARAHDSAGVGDTDDHRSGALGLGFLEAQMRQAEGLVALRTAEFSDAGLRAPDGDAARRFHGELVLRVAEIKEKRGGDHQQLQTSQGAPGGLDHVVRRPRR